MPAFFFLLSWGACSCSLSILSAKRPWLEAQFGRALLPLKEGATYVCSESPLVNFVVHGLVTIAAIWVLSEFVYALTRLVIGSACFEQ